MDCLEQWDVAEVSLLWFAPFTVERPGMIHPEKFGGTVAFNTGFRIQAFASKVEAPVWLLDE